MFCSVGSVDIFDFLPRNRRVGERALDNVANPVYSGHLVRAKLAFGPYERWLLLQESKAKERRRREEARAAHGDSIYTLTGHVRSYRPAVCP